MKVDINIPIKALYTKIKIDGLEIKRVRSLNIKASVDTIPTIVLELIPDEINIDGEALVLRDAQLESYTNEELMDIVTKRCLKQASKECE